MTRNTVWSDLAARLVAALKPIAAPIGIAFVPEARRERRAAVRGIVSHAERVRSHGRQCRPAASSG